MRRLKIIPLIALFWFSVCCIQISEAEMTRRVCRNLLAILLISTFVYTNEGWTSPEPKPTQDDQFDWQLIQHVFRQDSRNTALSTFSIKFLLNMVYEGTAPNSSTQQELNKPLGRNPTNHEAPRCVAVMQNLGTNSEQLFISSRIFADSKAPVSQKYTSILERQYHASLDSVNFQQPEGAAETINSWVSNSTRGMIPKLVNPQDIVDIELALLNAVYFKGTWVTVFSPNDTTIRPFRTASSQTVLVPFMEQFEYHYYTESEELQAQLVRLPYAGGRFSMIIVLPKENSNLNELLTALTPQSINAAIRSMEETEVILRLPRFRIEYGESLKKTLQQMGINRIFEDNAELDLMFTEGAAHVPTKVTDVLQKTVLVVDEKGSTASSASIGLVDRICGGCGPRKVEANRPFMFFIEEESTGTIVFAGKVENPAE